MGPIQPECNIGTLGHVDNGKSTLVQAITGVWTSRHSEELRRGITIRIGYADAYFYKCSKCSPPVYTSEPKCPQCGGDAEFLRGVSFIDCPGHHSLMVTMLSGAALMDGALFLVASDAKFPQAQDREHLLAAEIAGINKIIIVQNKIDIVSKERALENKAEIEKFIKGTVAEGAPIIPVSAQKKINIDSLIEAIEERIPTPKRDLSLDPKMYVLRSFEVNKPGTEVEDLVGGVIGGSIIQGKLRVGDEIEIIPGIRVEEGGRPKYEPLITTVESIHIGRGSVEEAGPGGLVALGTKLDPSLTKSDGLVGSLVGRVGRMPPLSESLRLEVKLFEKVVGVKEEIPTERIRMNEALVLNVGTSVTSGVVTSVRDDLVEISLRRPVSAEPRMKVAISRKIMTGWRLIGYGIVR
ncbi:MAG: translation initiation factor IF-2 subunit gamma [Candidatus Bathyarchaeia archaeon]